MPVAAGISEITGYIITGRLTGTMIDVRTSSSTDTGSGFFLSCPSIFHPVIHTCINPVLNTNKDKQAKLTFGYLWILFQSKRGLI